jgi:hypothetical protein
MEAPNIQLYNLFRHDLHLSDGKSLELMNVLDKEYKSSVKEDLAALSRQMSEGFQKVDARFQIIDDRFTKVDARFTTQDQRLVALDNKIDLRVSDLRGEIKDSKNDTNRWLIGIFLALILLMLATVLKK